MQNKCVGTTGYVLWTNGKTDFRTHYRIKRVYKEGELLLEALNADGVPTDDTLKVPSALFTAASALVDNIAVRSA